jgi:hypothetical protein
MVSTDALVRRTPHAILDPRIPIPTSGVVMLDGVPLEGAIVTFFPADNPGRRAAYGFTGPDGRFQLDTYTCSNGALPGLYRVLVVKRRAATGNLPPGFPINRGPDEWIVPPKYSQLAWTPLSYSVPVKGDVVLEVHGSASE